MKKFTIVRQGFAESDKAFAVMIEGYLLEGWEVIAVAPDTELKAIVYLRR